MKVRRMPATPLQNELLYKKLTVSVEDLTLVRRHARNLLERDGDFGPVRDDTTDYWERAALVSAMVMAYGRVFSRSNGLPDFPKRLAGYTAEEKAQHDELMHLRDTQYAHSDSATHHVRIVKGATFTSVHRMPPYSIPRHQLNLILSMVDKVRDNIEERQGSLYTEIMAQE